MMRSLAPDRERATLAIVAAAPVVAIPSTWGKSAHCPRLRRRGYAAARRSADGSRGNAARDQPNRRDCRPSSLFFAILFGLPLLAAAAPSHGLQLFEAFYRAGSLVFGGGHVVLPLLQASVVPPGWVTNEVFFWEIMGGEVW
jgi:chromate transporter